MARTDVEFRSGGVRCAAWLYRPEGEERVPLVVMAHGFSATRELRLPAYAERFCAAGIAVLLFDYRHFGASGGQPRQVLDIHKQQADYHAAIAHARTLPWVDPERVALFGSSFSGGHVVAVAVADPRVAAIVAQCPFTDGLASLRTVPPANALRGTATGIADLAGTLAGRPPRYVPAVGPPGTFAVMSTHDAQRGMDALRPPEGDLWENRVAARIALRVPSYRPGRLVAKLRCPALFCVTDQDTVAPADATVRLVSRAPRAEVKRYPVGHFDIYVGDAFERAVGDQVEFLTRHLGVRAATAASAV